MFGGGRLHQRKRRGGAAVNVLLRRILTLIATLLLVSLITFAVFQVIPGDPALIILGLEAEEEQIRALQQKLGSDQPLIQRFFNWLGGCSAGTWVSPCAFPSL